MRNFVKKFIENESGATAIEYGLLAALLAVAIVGALTSLSTRLSNVFNNVSDALK